MRDARVQRTDVDGVPVFWVEKPEPGPLQASLMFRVGKADETLPTNDITHLLEHLVLHGIDLSGEEVHRNGRVATGITSFDIVGEAAEVVRFLDGVCTGLAEPPVEHLDHERRVLEAEAARSSSSAATYLMFRRFGPAGPGLWWCQDFGRINADADTVRGWARARFTTGSAALFLNGPVPDGLRLRLPAGERVPPPSLGDDNLYAAPLWVEHQFPDVVAHAVVPRSASAVAWAAILQTRLVARLRTELGIAYSPSVGYDPYDDDLAMVTVTADAHPEHLAHACTVFTEELEAIAQDGPTADQLETYRSQALRQLEVEMPAAVACYRTAFDHVIGGGDKGVDDFRADIAALTPESIRSAAEAARARLLYGVPDGVELRPSSAQPMPSYSLHPEVVGSFYRPATGEPLVISLGTDAASYRGQGDSYVAVPFASCRGVLAWPDGLRTLVSDEGLTITIEPNLWNGGRGLVAAIDRATEAVRIPMPAREPQDVPQIADPPRSAPTQLPPGSRGLISGTVMLAMAGVSISSAVDAGRSISPVAVAGSVIGLITVGVSLLRYWFAHRASKRQRAPRQD